MIRRTASARTPGFKIIAPPDDRKARSPLDRAGAVVGLVVTVLVVVVSHAFVQVSAATAGRTAYDAPVPPPAKPPIMAPPAAPPTMGAFRFHQCLLLYQEETG